MQRCEKGVLFQHTSQLSTLPVIACFLALCATPLQVDWAVQAHERMLQGAHTFFQQHDLLLCPTVMLQPFDANIE